MVVKSGGGGEGRGLIPYPGSAVPVSVRHVHGSSARRSKPSRATAVRNGIRPAVL